MNGPTEKQIKERAIEMAEKKFGPGKVTRISDSLVARCDGVVRRHLAAAAVEIDSEISKAISQHKRSSKTMGAAVCEAIPPNAQRRATR